MFLSSYNLSHEWLFQQALSDCLLRTVAGLWEGSWDADCSQNRCTHVFLSFAVKTSELGNAIWELCWTQGNLPITETQNWESSGDLNREEFQPEMPRVFRHLAPRWDGEVHYRCTG